MELNEMEKRLLYQTEGSEWYAVLHELAMASRFAKDPGRRKGADSLIKKLNSLTDGECMEIVYDIRKNYRLPKGSRTVGEMLAEARQKSGAEQLKVHDIICKDGVDSIGSALKELEQHGYLTRRRIRFENGRLGDIEYMIHEKPVSGETEGDSPERENPEQVKPIQAKPKQGEPGQGKPAQLNTDSLNTDRLNTHQSIYPAGCQDGMNQMELAEAYREIIRENVEYGILAERYGEQRMDETVELILEVVLSKRPYIRIAGDDFPREVVRSRFLKINSSHVEYVFGCIDRNTTKVGNIKAYLLAALYNAPATMDSYYRTEVNHDLHGT